MSDAVEISQILVEPSEAGMRLDLLVGSRTGLGRAALRALFDAGSVSRNGGQARKGELACAGDRLTIAADHYPGVAVPWCDFALDVLLETDDLLVLSKPAGIPSAATLKEPTKTLAGALVARYPSLVGVGFRPAEPGLLHRLDTQTSGLLLAARTQPAHDYFREEMAQGRLEKHYLAICPAPEEDAFTIEAPLGPDLSDRRRVRVLRTGEGSTRRTTCVVLDRCPEWALVRVTLRLGYRHQIRAHLASRGLPLAGDVLYGGKELGLCGRHALHASQVAGTERSGATFMVESPLPEDLRGLWEALRGPAPCRF